MSESFFFISPHANYSLDLEKVEALYLSVDFPSNNVRLGDYRKSHPNLTDKNSLGNGTNVSKPVISGEGPNSTVSAPPPGLETLFLHEREFVKHAIRVLANAKGGTSDRWDSPERLLSDIKNLDCEKKDFYDYDKIADHLANQYKELGVVTGPETAKRKINALLNDIWTIAAEMDPDVCGANLKAIKARQRDA